MSLDDTLINQELMGINSMMFLFYVKSTENIHRVKSLIVCTLVIFSKITEITLDRGIVWI